MNILNQKVDGKHLVLTYRIGSNVIPGFTTEKEIKVLTIESQVADELKSTIKDILQKEQEFLKLEKETKTTDK